ncbi:MAG: carbohydate-binding domain-containing protein [Cytophagales bacterium]|nr:carbohydate-binding domain-containing protein [Cytophagales bacterium]
MTIKNTRINRFLPIALIFHVFLILGSCSSKEEITNIKLSWKLEKNFEQAGYSLHEAIFTITNTGNGILRDNWLLYWNQSPRGVVNVESEKSVEIVQINGDFYQMRLLPGFSLAENESVKIKLTASEWMIKEGDAPVGVYMVINNNGEETIKVVEDYTVEKFENPDQINRSSYDAEPIPTADYLYNQNLAVTRLTPEELYPVIPAPASYSKGKNRFVLAGGSTIQADKALQNEAAYLLATLDKNFNLNTTLLPETGQSATIDLKINTSIPAAEGYRLTVDNEKIQITGKDPAGVFYGMQTLIGLIEKKEDGSTLPTCKISDQPAYGYRGLHIDVSRNFQSKETILRVLDIMGHYKLNKLLIYITEDEGWRLEIEELPELTQISSKRGHTLNDSLHLQPSYGSGPFAEDPKSYGNGYYTRADFQEIIKYAKERHIEVIPSVNLPGHARAAIKAMEYRYHRLMKAGKEKEALQYRLIDPDDKSVYLSAQHYTDNIACVCQDAVYDFYEVVLDDIIELYKEVDVPLKMIHTGGDEVPPGPWSESPVCKEYLKNFPEIKNSRNLQNHFFTRLTEIINKKGLDIGGWEEVVMEYDDKNEWFTNTGFTDKNVYPYIWNNLWGLQDLGYKIANRGYPVILCNVTNLYFDLAYNKDPREPGLYWAGFNDTRDAFEFIPENLFLSTTEDNMGRKFNPEVDFKDMERLSPEGKKNIVGLQAQLWSETVRGRDMLEYYILPKLLGFAHRAWQGQASWGNEPDADKRLALINEDWNRFANTLGQKEFEKLANWHGGYDYRIPPPGIREDNGMIYMNTAYPGLIIRYTTDGSEPTTTANLYDGAFNFAGGTIKAKCFNTTGRSGLSTTINK